MTDESCVSEVQDNAVSQDLGQASGKAAVRTGGCMTDLHCLRLADVWL